MLRESERYSRKGNVAWSPLSIDLTACDFFVMGYLKRMFKEIKFTVFKANHYIRDEFEQIMRREECH